METQWADGGVMGTAASDFLAHYGVKGMKWGVRKDRSRSSSSSRRERSEDSARASAAATKAKSKGYDSLSNAEMRQLLERLNLERQMTQLQPAQVSNGRKFANGALKTVKYTNNVLNFVNSPAGRLLVRGIDTMIKVEGRDAHLIEDTIDNYVGKRQK